MSKPNLPMTLLNATYDTLGLASSAQAFAIQRANHTGVQPVASVTGAFSSVNVVTDYGAKGDGKVIANGAMTSGSNVLSGSGFLSSDVGKAIIVVGAGTPGAPGANLTTTIASFTSSTSVTLALAAASTVSGASVSYGTDDTTAFINCVTAAGPLGLHVLVPAPKNSHYVLTGSLTINNWYGLCIRGDSWETTEIRQYTDNMPIFRFPLDNCHSQTFERMRLTYAAPQNITIGPRSVAFARDNTNGTSSLSGHYHHAYRDLKIFNATYGFAVLRQSSDTTSTNPWWGCEWSRILFSGIGRACISLNLGTVGAPCNRFDQIKVFQNYAVTPNDGIEACFTLRGEAVMTAIDVEQWVNQVLNIPSGNHFTIRDLHIEHHRITNNTGGNRTIYAANTNVAIDGLFLAYDDTNAFARYGVYADSNAYISVKNVAIQTPNTASIILVTGNATSGSSRITVESVNPTGFGSGVSVWLAASTTISDLVSIDGQAPMLQATDALPTASATYRNRRYLVPGNGTTTADTTVQCLMSSSGTYSWKTVVSG